MNGQRPPVKRCDTALPRFHVSLMGAFSPPKTSSGGLLGCFPARARAWLRASKHPKAWLCAPKLPKPEIESVPLYTKLVFEAPRLSPWSVLSEHCWPCLHINLTWSLQGSICQVVRGWKAHSAGERTCPCCLKDNFRKKSKSVLASHDCEERSWQIKSFYGRCLSVVFRKYP